MKPTCYECNREVLETNQYSRCLQCVTKANDVNKEIAAKCLSIMEAIKQRTSQMLVNAKGK